MPWSRNEDLPSSVRSALPSAAQNRFRSVANDRLRSGGSESSAMRQAWHVVGRGWTKPKDGGKWVRKQDPGEGGQFMEAQVLLKADIVGTEEEQRLVWGWGSVTMLEDSELVDLHNDVIESDELVRAASVFMEEIRTAKVMHQGAAVGLVLHSLPLTYELAKTLGLTTRQEGWIVGVKVFSDEVWERVKSGELGAFSIGGRAQREVIEG